MNPLTPRRRPATLRLAVRDGVIAALSIAVGAGLGLAVTVIAVETGLMPDVTADSFPYQSADSSVVVQQPVDAAGALVEAHDCWTGGHDMPADMRGEYPGHVVVTRPGADTPTYSAALVGPALDQVFGADPHTHLTVHAFCR